MRSLLFVSLVLPLSAFAGSSSRDCETSDKAIVMGAGNSSNQVQIAIVLDGKKAVFEAPVKIMPEFDYNTVENEKTITAIPVSAESVVKAKHQVMHVKHKDGTECDGRESWDVSSVQSYVLTGKDGQPLTNGAGLDAAREALKHTKYITADGYLVASFQCRAYGVTSPGGCHAAEGDEVTWRDLK